MVRPGPNQLGHRFVGMTALSWLAQLRNARSPDFDAACRWYWARVEQLRAYCDKRPRVAEPYFGVELAAPRMVSLLAASLRATGLKRASAAQWRSTVQGLSAKGIREEEIRFSGVLDGLAQAHDGEMLTLEQVLALIDTSHLNPRLVAESTQDFITRGGWQECCLRISPPHLRGLAVRRQTQHRNAIRRALVRYRHRTFGWRLVREAWLPDLFGPERHLWYIQDERGRPLERARATPYATLAEAMAAADDAMFTHFPAWDRAHPVQYWGQHIAGGAEQYSELLVQLDEWPTDYRPSHFRTRNVLAHVRTSMRTSVAGDRLFYLDEVQSDWHADLHEQTVSGWPSDRRPIHEAPYGKEWPLLVLKLMLWRAQAIGADALAWSTLEMQEVIWGLCNRVPKILYLRTLPDAARAIAKALKLEKRDVQVTFHEREHTIESSDRGWLVKALDDRPVTKPFDTRQQAERYLALTVGKFEQTVPALMLAGLPRIRRIPLFGVGGLGDWVE
jgi:hypothetical protein